MLAEGLKAHSSNMVFVTQRVPRLSVIYFISSFDIGVINSATGSPCILGETKYRLNVVRIDS